ncbi:MAG: hypothetical protein LBJ74_04490, partial [Heliobacteriaceae bacterium]|nr:hypothetical protein [Heliobacteriaceae bacterium]
MAKNFEELTDILNNNTAELEKVLSGISDKLDVIAEDSGAVDLIRVYLSELKNILEEQYSISAAKSDNIEGVFKNLESRLDDFYERSPEKDELILLVSSIKSEFEESIKKLLKGLKLANESTNESIQESSKHLETLAASNTDILRKDMKEGFNKLEAGVKTAGAHNADYVIETMSEAVGGLKVYLKELSSIPGAQESIAENLTSIEKFIEE